MTVKYNGGPAFPVLQRLDSPSHEYTAHSITGLTIRDHFAGLAMSALIGKWDGASGREITQVLCQAAYSFADAMLAERNKP